VSAAAAADRGEKRGAISAAPERQQAQREKRSLERFFLPLAPGASLSASNIRGDRTDRFSYFSVHE